MRLGVFLMAVARPADHSLEGRMPERAFVRTLTARSRFRERDLRANLPLGKAISVPALKRVVPNLAQIGARAPLDRRTTCRKLSSRLASWPSSQPARPSPSRCRWPSPPSRPIPASTSDLRAGQGGSHRLAPTIPAERAAFCNTPYGYLAEIFLREYALSHSITEWGRVKWSEFLWAPSPVRLCLWAVRPSRSLRLSPWNRSIPANMAVPSQAAAVADRPDGSSTRNTRLPCPTVRCNADRSRRRWQRQRSDRRNASPSSAVARASASRRRLARHLLRPTQPAGTRPERVNNEGVTQKLSARRPSNFKAEGASC